MCIRDRLDNGPQDVREQILETVLQAAKGAELRHLVVVDPDGAIVPKLQATGVPYTCMCIGNELTNTPSYSFKDGVRAQITVSSSPCPSGAPLCREDVASACVQALQSLPWTQSRTLYLSSTGASPAPASHNKRIDQQWCVNAEALEAAMLAHAGSS